MAPRTPFVFPTNLGICPAGVIPTPANPGVYPAGVIPAAQWLQQQAEHKALIKQFQTCVGMTKGLKELILQAVKEDFVLELRAEQMGYLNVTPFQMMTHLQTWWSASDFVESNALMAKCGSLWILVEVPAKYFN